MSYCRIFTYDGSCSLRAWLTGVVKNVAMNLFTDNKLRNQVSFDPNLSLDCKVVDLPDRSVNGPLSEAIFNEMYQLCSEQVKLKYPQGYDCFILRVRDGFSPKESSSLLGINQNVARQRLCRARKIARDFLRKKYLNYSASL